MELFHRMQYMNRPLLYLFLQVPTYNIQRLSLLIIQYWSTWFQNISPYRSGNNIMPQQMGHLFCGRKKPRKRQKEIDSYCNIDTLHPGIHVSACDIIPIKIDHFIRKSSWNYIFGYISTEKDYLPITKVLKVLNDG